VLDVDGAVIPGLYAAGEVLGCVIGSRYSAGGVSIANAVVFGRHAGQSAAAELTAAQTSNRSDAVHAKSRA